MSKENLKILIASKKRAKNQSVLSLDTELVYRIAEDIVATEIAVLHNEMEQRTKEMLKTFQKERDKALNAFARALQSSFNEYETMCDEMKGETAAEIRDVEAKQRAKFNTLMEHVKTLKGQDGKDGKDGVGLPGPVGEKGEDGSPDTPDQVVEKVIVSTKNIPLSKINGLVEEITNIKKAIREKRGGGGGGGGMGQPQHEKFTVSATTTTIQTAYKIGAGGRAIFHCAYQGQIIRYGEHYTVGSDLRTLTLTFTPDDNTTIEIAYVR